MISTFSISFGQIDVEFAIAEFESKQLTQHNE